LLIVIIRKKIIDCVNTYTIIAAIEYELNVISPLIEGIKCPLNAENESIPNEINIKT
jgi:hypothetical protein